MKFADAQKKMITYLKSADFAGRDDAQTTVSSVPILEKIIKGGLITIDSQEGVCKSGFEEVSRKFYRFEERAYVSGFMKRDAAKDFVQRFNSESNKIAFIVQNEPRPGFYEEFWASKTATPSIPVTVQGSATTKAGIKELEPATQAPTVLPSKLIDFQKKEAHLNKSEAVEMVYCIDPVYCRKASAANGLYKDILKALN